MKKNMKDEEKQKLKDYQKQYRKNMTDDKNQKIIKGNINKSIVRLKN